MSTIEQHTRPHFARGVRMQWDNIRSTHVLLFPEGAIVLNSTAAAVLELCDGKHSLSAIVAELEELYQGASVENDVLHLLSRLVQRGLISLKSYDDG